jgi:predicted O-linked N-acetylglucosamine transferase (SPINDLY family)
MRIRLKKEFDRFIDVENMSDLEIAELSRSLEIDIAIDLTGPTFNSRTGIFYYRAAPIQVNWLGYAGTIGAKFIDYIVADNIVIPESHREYYFEKILYLPNTFIVDDSKRVASSKPLSKQEFGLPENAFIFCCFNNSYKFNAQTLESWSRILLAIPSSVMWISENNLEFSRNIKIEFKKLGVEPSRVIFSKPLDLMADYLARFAVADLFLDTHPYNAHTTALDSLKAGLPVLTRLGSSFASRVAGSILNAIGLSELVTTSEKEYEALAIELASNATQLINIKNKLIQNRLTTPLFNTTLFTKNLETAYTLMYERYQAGLDPDHINVH